MRYVGALFFLLALLARPAASAPEDPGNIVTMTPTIRLYVCPATFQFRSDCNALEKTLEPQKVELVSQVQTQRLGQWSFQATDPVAASFFVIVARSPENGHWKYSVSAETGLPTSPAPFANARVEFSEGSVPPVFVLSSATMEKDGKKYLTEIRIAGFSGPPLKASPSVGAHPKPKKK